MLSKLILDIGNVICEWNPDALAASAFDDEQDRQAALGATVRNADWLALDSGSMDVEEATARAQARSSLDPSGIAKIYTNLGSTLLPLTGTMEAMHRAKAAGVPIYILSNMARHTWEHLARSHDCWEACEGVVVSCDVGINKPDPAIYQHLCERFSLAPESCVFVDDMAENIEAARAFGMQGVQLTDKYAGGQVVDELVARIVSNR